MSAIANLPEGPINSFVLRFWTMWRTCLKAGGGHWTFALSLKVFSS